MPPVRFTEVFRAGWQGRKVRFIQVLAFGSLLGALLAAVQLWPPPAHGDESVMDRRLAAAVGMAFGLAFAGGMGYYGRVYVASVAYDAVGQQYHIATIGPFGYRRVVPEADLRPPAYHEGAFTTYKHRVNAPWYTLRIPGTRPLLLDPQGDILDEPLWRRLTRDA